MNNKLNQGFSSFDTISIIGSLVVIVAIAFPILSRRINYQHVDVARQQAQDWTQQILANEISSDTNTGSFSKGSGERQPASEGSALSNNRGEIGADPWGLPYKYAFIRNSQGQPIYVAVWSSGPNAQNETPIEKLHSSAEGPSSIKFEGDDVGFVRSVR